MKINNIDEFTEIFNFVFSSQFELLGKTEKNNIKEEIRNAIKKFPETEPIIKETLKNEVRRADYYGDFNGSIQNIIFIYKMFSDEEKMKFLIANVINSKVRNNEYLLFILLDFLDIEDKVKVLAKLTNKELLYLMSNCNQVFLSDRKKLKTRIMYKRYYFVMKKTLKYKELR